MSRIKCVVSYDGSKFHGFQVQDKYRTVQGEIQKAIYNICKEKIVIHGSGRTDAKVHGSNQVFHFDTTKEFPAEQWKQAINHFLPNDIYILSSVAVTEEFHSRYSAIKKEYHYKLSMKEYNPLETNYIYQYGKNLDIDIMREVSKLFLGEHDFASFCSYDQYGNTIRTLYDFHIKEKEGIITFILIGNGFRRYMVRHIVGALIQVGANRMTKETVEEMMQSCGDKKCLHKAKPQGLYLHKVYYE
ncbi:MAG: tRNA pseudouridine(38-40) synthase TruA [Coprobacillaceae bacterium]